MRDSLDALLDIFHDRGKLRTLCDALERGGRRRSRRNREQNLDVQGILTEVRSDIDGIVMAARQLPPEEGGPIGAAADAAGKKIEKALRQLGAEVAASHGAKEG